MSTTAEKPKPFLLPQYCKGCGRCIESCARHCIEMGTEIDPRTGLIPVVLHLENCSACGLCFDACPEPYGLAPEPGDTYELQDPAKLFGRKPTPAVNPVPIPDERLALPATRPLVTKGTYASAIGALLAGCRHFFGYPITPSTEGAELMAKLLPQLDGVFVLAVRVVPRVNFY
jgi:NAD-dependent dihydropyrimidine dehydrogenase PreA subunit